MEKQTTFHSTFMKFILFICISGLLISFVKRQTFFADERPVLAENNVSEAEVSNSAHFNQKKNAISVREDTNILLTVDTENITEETVNEHVKITDDRSNPAENSSSPSDHIALVDKNMKVYWSAVPLNSEGGTTVDVLGIFRKPEGGAEILEGVFRDPNKDGVIMGKIKNKKIDGLEYYNIMIRINGVTPQTFMIDPKLKMTTGD
ncbi:hypothetical protein [Salinimicrobium oceani]|uniref:Uncharacterized protein n=1 Tax=Salinimicrobium oceani TaxID=2722702 RepID=A0ABX1D261_9FLAO|nr:hypothetical protein [Salinimicrobium oceani]NJW53759.1 hypothetical protein [Salinimicrobium oceani]